MARKRLLSGNSLMLVSLSVAILSCQVAQAQAPSAQSVTPGLFRPTVAYDSGAANTIALAVADVNGDGNADLVVANQCADPQCGTSSVGVLIGNGDGSFQPVKTYGGVGSLVVALAVADLNGDGKPDLIVANFLSSTVTTLLGNGDGTFRPGATYGSGGMWAQAVTVADVNGDGKPDLVVGNATGAGMSNRSVSVLLGNGDGTFRTATGYDSGGTDVSSVTVVDVNRDGRPDLVVANGCGGGNCANQGSVAVLLGNDNGTFQAPVTYSSGGYLTGWVTEEDVNGDGNLDVIVTNCTSVGPIPPAGSATCPNVDGVIGVLLGNGDGGFQPARTYDSGGLNASALAVADFDGDGKADLAVLTSIQSKTLAVLLGNGDGTFQSANAYDSGGVFSSSVAVADLNHDGKPDLAVANQFSCSNGCGTGSVGVLLNNTTTGKSATSTSLISSLNPSIYGQKVTWTATITSSGSITPTGKVEFTWQRFTIGSATVNGSGVATLSRSNLNADAYPLTAVYSGDAANLGSTSAVLNQVVQQTTSAATIGSSPNPSTQGQPVTFTATITSPTAKPTGPVNFTAGKMLLGTAQLSAGEAKLTISSLPVGSTKVTVTYGGSSNIAKSSASVTQKVQQ